VIDVAGPQLGVDRHLLARHRVEREARRHLGHPLGPLGDDDELDHRQDEEDDRADHQVAGHHEVAEGADHVARVGAQEDETGRRDLQGQPEQRGQEQQRREGGDLEGVADVDGDQQERHRRRDVDRDQQVEQRRRQRDDHHPDDRDHQAGQPQVGIAREEPPHVARPQEAHRLGRPFRRHENRR
jgi:hypothetical protein